MSSLSLKPSNSFTCHSEQSSISYSGLKTSTQSVLLTSTLPFLSLPYLPLDFSTTGLLFIPWLYQTWYHLTFFTVAVPSNQNPLSPDTHMASSNGIFARCHLLSEILLTTLPKLQLAPPVHLSSRTSHPPPCFIWFFWPHCYFLVYNTGFLFISPN